MVTKSEGMIYYDLNDPNGRPFNTTQSGSVSSIRNPIEQCKSRVQPGTMKIKFKRKGSWFNGVKLHKALSSAQLKNFPHPMCDMHPDYTGTILLKIQWVELRATWMYEIPLASEGGHVNLTDLAHRISEACNHYQKEHFTSGTAPKRIKLLRLQEISYGVWQPVLKIRK